MKTYGLLIIVCIFTFASFAIANDVPRYGSLEEFCVETKKDTEKNCECGQATADKIMTPEEQAIALALMLRDSDVLSQLRNKRVEFMAKLSQVTNGCT